MHAVKNCSNAPFEFLEHTADVYIAAYGKTLEECFQNAALALFEVMTDTGKVQPTYEEEFVVEGEDTYALLYSWLEQLLVNFETTGRLYSVFKVEIAKTKEGYTLRGNASGEPFNPTKHPQRTGVKAVTYHQMAIGKEKGRVFAKFILDI